MTKEQLKVEINKAITHIARGSGFMKEEVENILKEMYIHNNSIE